MTLEELYELIGGNFDQVQKIMRKERLIDKHIRKLADSELCNQLIAAGDQMDATGLYENAHALKGVCANLGLDDLAAAASEITEEFRPGNDRRFSDDEVKAKLQDIADKFDSTKAGIQQYANANA